MQYSRDLPKRRIFQITTNGYIILDFNIYSFSRLKIILDNLAIWVRGGQTTARGQISACQDIFSCPNLPILVGNGYFVVKTALPSPILAKNWPLYRKTERKTVSDFPPNRNTECPWKKWTFYSIKTVCNKIGGLLAFRPFSRREVWHSFFPAIWHFLVVLAPSAVFTTK